METGRRLLGLLLLGLGCGSEATEIAPTDATTTFATSSSSTASTEGSSSSEADTGGTADPSTGVVVPMCGNSVVEGDEPCDDGNTDPLDGCLSQCRPGPDGIDFTAGASLTYQGGGGGVRYDDACPVPEVMVGLRGHNDGILQRVQVVCGLLDVVEVDDALELSITQGSVLPERGTGDATPYDRTCPPNHAVVGFSGAAGEKLDSVVLHCAPVLATASNGGFGLVVDTDAVVELDAVGGSGGTDFGPEACGAAEVVTSAVIRAAGDINGLGLECSALSFGAP